MDLLYGRFYIASIIHCDDNRTIFAGRQAFSVPSCTCTSAAAVYWKACCVLTIFFGYEIGRAHV